MLNRLFLAFLLCMMVSALPAGATSVQPLYLDQIIDSAATVFEGTCISNRSERDARTGLIVTYTTFQVQDPLKGAPTPTHTIKQIGGRLVNDDGSVQGRRVEGVPGFEVGEHYIVFLYGTSSAGFSSPVGLDQGKFSINSDASGAHVGNGRDFKEMTANRPALRAPSATQARLSKIDGAVDQMDLNEFKQIVRLQTGVSK